MRSSPFTLKTIAFVFGRKAPRVGEWKSAYKTKSADIHVRTATAVQEVEVQEHRLAVSRKAGRNPADHLIEVEGLVPITASSSHRRQTWQRRHIDLRLETCRNDLSSDGGLDRQNATIHEEDVRIEGRSLMASPHVLDETEDPYTSATRHLSFHEHRVV